MATTLVIPVTPGVNDCLRDCGNEAESPSESVFHLCAGCADSVYRVFMAPAIDSGDPDKITAAYRAVGKMYGRTESL